MIKPVRWCTTICIALLSISQALALPDTPQASDTAALTVNQLRQAITGERFAYRGQFREGAAATEFAEGYIFALAERSSQQGLWCGFEKLLPHELLERVFESLPAQGHAEINKLPFGTNLAAGATSAAEQVVSFLQNRFPCTTEHD